jgi:hypothetical protein
MLAAATAEDAAMIADAVADAERTLFADALTCTYDVPAALRSNAPDSVSLERATEHAETVLRSLALIEDSPHEEADEHGGKEPALQRLDAKLNLVLETLAGLLRRERGELPMQRLRLSRFGAELLHPSSDPPPRGFLLLQPLGWLPQRLELPVVCLAQRAEAAGCRVWLRFEPQPPSLEQALERHLFRLHRRQIALRKA